MLRDNHDNDTYISTYDSNYNKGNNDVNNGNSNDDNFHEINNETDNNHGMIDKTLEMIKIIRMMMIREILKVMKMII